MSTGLHAMVISGSVVFLAVVAVAMVGTVVYTRLVESRAMRRYEAALEEVFASGVTPAKSTSIRAWRARLDGIELELIALSHRPGWVQAESAPAHGRFSLDDPLMEDDPVLLPEAWWVASGEPPRTSESPSPELRDALDAAGVRLREAGVTQLLAGFGRVRLDIKCADAADCVRRLGDLRDVVVNLQRASAAAAQRVIEDPDRLEHARRAADAKLAELRAAGETGLVERRRGF